ncbi:alpha/beta hydrolase family protein [Kitasatospora sp. NPDC056327]|uniref:alpha/beta hydrolase family protein n=1 Tax=Kitasatospora sp. NPDC056327 TaxID=3345785 RepID=UPI0035E2C51A
MRERGRGLDARGLRTVRRGVAVALAATTVLGVAGTAAVPASAAPAVADRLALAALAKPTGPYPVGTTALRLADPGRRDPWEPDRVREVMISLWYPATRPVYGNDHARYMAESAARHFGGPDGAGVLNNGAEPGRTDWSRVRTHARQDAPALPAVGPRPVVLYSAGLGDPRSWGTGLAEDLASRGYVVVTVDHPHEASEVAFPDGRLVTSVLPGPVGRPGPNNGALLRGVMAVRVADIRFVLDELAALRTDGRLPGPLAGSLDLGRIGMAGHCAGGFTAAQAMHDDPRIRAGVNLDGQLHLPGPDGTGVHLSSVAENGLDRPFLLMGTESPDSGGYAGRPGWAAFWRNTRGWKADVTLLGSRHGSYTDAQALLPQLARQGAVPEEAVRGGIGEVRPDRAVLATRAYVASFFDRQLRGHDDHLLDGPSRRFPEMRFER